MVNRPLYAKVRFGSEPIPGSHRGQDVALLSLEGKNTNYGYALCPHECYFRVPDEELDTIRSSLKRGNMSTDVYNDSDEKRKYVDELIEETQRVGVCVPSYKVTNLLFKLKECSA